MANSGGGCFLPNQAQTYTGTQTFDTIVATTATITNLTSSTPTLASPVISGTVTGGASYTAPTLTAPAITGAATIATGSTITAPAIVGATITGTVTIANGSTITTPVLSGTVTGTYTLGGTPTLASAAGCPYTAGVAAGYKLARGVHTQAAASDTVVTGLATVVACISTFQSAPTVKQLYSAASIGNQSGAPAAGSILMNTYKPTAVNDCTPTAATDFSENLVFNWIAIGT